METSQSLCQEKVEREEDERKRHSRNQKAMKDIQPHDDDVKDHAHPWQGVREGDWLARRIVWW
jgi:hypothetical protein